MRSSPLKSVFRFVFRDLGWKLLSIGAAVLLWVFAVSEPPLSSFVSVPVQFKGLPDGLEISSDVIESVYLEIRGPAGELRSMGEHQEYAVVVDMSQVRPGERTFTVGDSDVILPRGTHLVRAIPSQLRFEFERRAWRVVPVEVRFGRPQPGYEIASHEVSPSTLQIVGPQSRVNRVHAVTTDPVDISQVVGASEFHVAAFVDDPHVRFTSPPKVAVKVHVKALAEVSANRTR